MARQSSWISLVRRTLVVLALLLLGSNTVVVNGSSSICQGTAEPPATILVNGQGSCMDWSGEPEACCQQCHAMYAANHISRYIPPSSSKPSSQCCCYYQGLLEHPSGNGMGDNSVFFIIQTKPKNDEL